MPSGVCCIRYHSGMRSKALAWMMAALAVAGAAAKERPVAVKVVVVTMFERGGEPRGNQDREVLGISSRPGSGLACWKHSSGKVGGGLEGVSRSPNGLRH